MPDRSHYGVYGENCAVTGQFDAGVCSLCKIKKILDNNNHNDCWKVIQISKIITSDHMPDWTDEF